MESLHRELVRIKVKCAPLVLLWVYVKAANQNLSLRLDLGLLLAHSRPKDLDLASILTHIFYALSPI